MKQRIKKELSNPLRVIVLACGMMLLSLWVLDAEEKRTAAPIAEPSTEPDFYMSGVDTIEYDDKGRPKLRMKADEMSHYPFNDITDIAKPNIEILSANNRPWQISAHYGQIMPGGEQVELRGRVRVALVGDHKSSGELRTESLSVFPDREYAETNEAVTIISAQGKTTAKGMQADLRTSRVKLLDKVRGQYHGNMLNR